MSENNAQEMRRRKRSPSYPYINLKQAVELTAILYRTEGLNQTPATLALEHLDYSTTSSSGARVLSTLLQFGLLEEIGRGDDKLVRVSDIAISILEAPDNDVQANALCEAALKPESHREVWERWKLAENELPSSQTMRYVLLKEVGFHTSAVDSFIDEFIETYEYAGLRNYRSREAPSTPQAEVSQTASIVTDRILQPARQVPPGMKEHTIQLIGQPMARLILPHPITDRNLSHLIEWLRFMGPALTVPEDEYVNEDQGEDEEHFDAGSS